MIMYYTEYRIINNNKRKEEKLDFRSGVEERSMIRIKYRQNSKNIQEVEVTPF